MRWVAASEPVARVKLRRASPLWRLQRRSLTDRVRFWMGVMKKVHLSDADAILAVVSQTAALRGCFAVGPRWHSPRLDAALRVLSASTLRGAVVKSNTPGGTIMHELGHVLGLPDLYDYEFARDHKRWSVRASRFVGSWDLMGRAPSDETNTRPHPMAWTKSLAGWIEPMDWSESRSRYVVGPGAGAVRVPVGPGEWMYVEGRLRQGFDAALSSEGVLVSVANERLPEGRGPLRLVVPTRGSAGRRRPVLGDAALQPQETCAFGNVTVSVLSRTPHGFDVSIVRG